MFTCVGVLKRCAHTLIELVQHLPVTVRSQVTYKTGEDT